MKLYRSWAYNPQATQVGAVQQWRNSDLPQPLGNAGSLLAFGNGRSYGDSCLNTTGSLIDCRAMDHFIQFDSQNGVLRCEAGVLLSEILKIVLPQGWFLPVTPGTSFATIGGALANDVHGKNHHRDGCFGNHVRAFELIRSDGSRQMCTPEQNADLFSATIGGLGLTGLVTWIEVQLIAVTSDQMNVDTIAFHGLEEFVELSISSKNSHQYTVAWLDCSAKGSNFARGIFIRANHSDEHTDIKRSEVSSAISVPFNFPSWCLNSYSIKAFNTLYFNKHRSFSQGQSSQNYASYFYPLDGLRDWNRIYGRRGFYQYQYVVPSDNLAASSEILKRIVQSGQGSFLAVLKEFGSIESPGMMSFPKPGLCLALDFPNNGASTLKLLDELDHIVMAANGSVYPAKDNRMSADAFKQYYPQAGEFLDFIDPGFNSDFWRRVSA